MKTPSLIFFIALLLSFSCSAQLNELTVEELENITFNNIALGDIMGINGQDSKAEALFGKGNFESLSNDYENPNPNSQEDCPFWCKYYQFFTNGVYVRFEKFSVNESVYYFTYLKVKDPSVIVTVKDVSIALGDDISIFEEKGYVISEKYNWVVFVDKETSTIDITFHFDPSTRKVEAIKMDTY